MKRYLRGMGFYLVIFIAIIAIFSLTTSPEKQKKDIYSDLILKIQQGEVTELSVVDNVATATLNDGTTMEVEVPGYSVLKEDAGAAMQNQISEGKLHVDTPLPYSPPWWLTLLPTLGLIAIFAIFWFVFMQQSSGGGGRGMMNFGKSKARVSVDGKTSKTFDDVAGADAEKEELEEIKK